MAFFDADLEGFEKRHVDSLLHGAAQGYDMVCGLRDYGKVGGLLQLTSGPLITGERVLRRWILERIAGSCWDGYSIETAMNFICDLHGGRVCLVVMDGVRIRGKVKKGGVFKGLHGHVRMFTEIAMTKAALRQTDGAACKL